MTDHPNIMAEQGGSIREFVIKAAATGLGLGYLPLIPGTFGTLAGIPVCLALGLGGRVFYISGTLILTVIGVRVADEAERIFGTHDSKKVVIDEICGFLVSMTCVTPGPLTIGLAFILFRFFDILKPFPVGCIDRKLPGGVGVMLDDTAAGVYANLSLWAIIGIMNLVCPGVV